uniref:PDEase domain-containing protein n=1 Tax=Schistosoma curassoni TaxID=6186 RepID=A0A183KFY6_9TREM
NLNDHPHHHQTVQDHRQLVIDASYFVDRPYRPFVVGYVDQVLLPLIDLILPFDLHDREAAAISAKLGVFPLPPAPPPTPPGPPPNPPIAPPFDPV